MYHRVCVRMTTRRPPSGGNDDVLKKLNRQLAEYKIAQRAAMMNHLRFEMKKREILDDHYETLEESRRSIADQTTRYLHDLEDLTESRVDVSLNYVLADILEDLNELQRELNALKNIENVDDDHDDIVRNIFKRMNDGLFFKKLYSSDSIQRPAESTDPKLYLTIFILGIIASRIFMP
jgi:hypothetical protein